MNNSTQQQDNDNPTPIDTRLSDDLYAEYQIAYLKTKEGQPFPQWLTTEQLKWVETVIKNYNNCKSVEDTMTQIHLLCVRYYEMFMMERACKNCEDMNNYEKLVEIYGSAEKSFHQQYEKVQNLVAQTKKK